jgi:hypothetical protein
MLVEGLLAGLLLISDTQNCRMDARDLDLSHRDRDFVTDQKLSQAERLCWDDPQRGRQELESLRHDMLVESLKPPPPSTALTPPNPTFDKPLGGAQDGWR